MTETTTEHNEGLEGVRLNAHERRLVAATAVSNERTVANLYAGKPVRETSAIRLLRAIEELGLPKPARVVTR